MGWGEGRGWGGDGTAVQQLGTATILV